MPGACSFRLRERGLAIERALQYRLQTLIRTSAEFESAFAGGFKSLVGVGFAKADDSDAGAIAHLGMGFLLQHRLNDLCCCLTHGFGPVNQPRRGPFEMRLMTLRHVFLNCGVVIRRETAQMRCDALTRMEDLDCCGGEARFQLLARKLVGNAVIMTVNLDVIIDGGPNRLPVGSDIALYGKGLQRRKVEGGKQ